MSILYDISLALINSITYIFLLFLFLKNFPYQYKSKTQLIITLISTSIVLFLDFLLVNVKIIHLCILIVCTLIVSLALHNKWYNHLFFTFVFIAVSAVIESLVGAGLALAFSIDISQSNVGVYYVIGLLISKLIIFMIVILMRLKRYKKMSNAKPHILILIFLFPISTISILILQYNFYCQIPFGSSLSGLFILCYSLLIVANFVLFYVMDTLQSSIEKDIEIKVADTVIEKQSEQYAKMLEHKEELLRIRHDMKNFIIGLSSALKSNNFSEAKIILNKKYETLDNDSYLYQSEASVIYSIINTKQVVAQSRGVELDFSYGKLTSLKISNIDFAIILGSLLDNAIESTEKVPSGIKLVTTYIDMKEDNIVINVKNPTNYDIDINTIKTSKDNSWQHGFGIMSVKRLVSKYNGEIAFKCANKEFQVSVILNNPTT